MEESFLHFIWKFQSFAKAGLKTTEGEQLNILKPGIHNTDAGPDFLNGKVEIDGIEWYGHIEIHIKSSDWNRHNHQQDQGYDNVILHVVFDDDQKIKRTDGTTIPTLDLSDRLNFSVFDNYKRLISSISPVPCAYKLPDIPDQVKYSALDKALIERLQTKGNLILNLLKKNNYDWEETAYQFLARSFGFKVNSETFFELGKALSYKILKKHADNKVQVEAMLFGVAGFLSSAPNDEYSELLKREYSFLSHKYGLIERELNLSRWKFLRLRPANFPTVRIAQFAAVISHARSLSSSLFEIKNYPDARAIFSVSPSKYWKDHYNFGKKQSFTNEGIGEDSIENLIINTICPLLAAYRMDRDDVKYIDQAMRLLEEIKAEKNKITRVYDGKLIKTKTAFDSQAVIELHNSYCLARKCLECNIGTYLIRS